MANRVGDALADIWSHSAAVTTLHPIGCAPTLAGLRRCGYTPEAIREFCRRIGIAKTDSRVDMAFLEDCMREDLNRRSPRAMAVLDTVTLGELSMP